MPLRSEHVAEIKSIVKESINETLNSAFIGTIVESVLKNLNLETLQKKVDDNCVKITKLQEDTENKHRKIDNNLLQLEKEKLRQDTKIDNLDQQLKINNVRVIGVKEEPNEDTYMLVENLFSSKLGITVSRAEICQCYRDGKQIRDRSRSILVKFCNTTVKSQILKNRSKLKGSQLTIVEDLSARRYALLRDAKRMLGRNKVWSYNGNIFVSINNDKHKINGIEDIGALKATGRIQERA